jgi:proline dehydrogenase
MRQNYLKIIEAAKMKGIFVWLDMEEPQRVPSVIRLYLEVARHVRGGICIQANLKRSLADVKTLVKANGVVRLVKGAYGNREDGGVIVGRDEVNRSYRGIMEYLFVHSSCFMIATHDTELVKDAMALNNRYRRNVSYAMLNGINNSAARELAAIGESVVLYLPFGTRWVGYSYRRLREAGHARLILSSLFRSQQL